RTAEKLNGCFEPLVQQFDLNPQQIRQAALEVEWALSPGAGTDPREAEHALWAACRKQARPQLDNLAQRIEPAATWQELVLPPPQVETLREIALQVRNRGQVYEKWRFAARSSRGLGISALFSGASGTGKTMASEVLANELALD